MELPNICNEDILQNSQWLTYDIEYFLKPFPYICYNGKNSSLKDEGYEWSKRFYHEHKDDRAVWKTLESELK